MSIVVPAVLPSSRQEFEEKLALFARLPGVERVQIDVVDGKFASPASWPYSAEATKSRPTELEMMMQNGEFEMLPALEHIEYEIDLMSFDAERAALTWLALGATRLTFHAESTTDLPKLLAAARAHYGSVVSYGVALNIASSSTQLEPCLGEIDYVQLMGIAEIGKQGQPFDQRVYEKVIIVHKHHPEIRVQIDGGVSLENARKLLALGASTLIIGSGILRASDPAAEVAKFEALSNPYGV